MGDALDWAFQTGPYAAPPPPSSVKPKFDPSIDLGPGQNPTATAQPYLPPSEGSGMPTDSIANENPPRSGQILLPPDAARPRANTRTVGQGGTGGSGGGQGGTTAGGGGAAGSRSGIRAYAQDLADIFPDRFGDADKDIAQQRKDLAEAKGENVNNALIRMGSAMMEGGAKSGNFMGIMGLGLRSGQDEMTLRQAQQEKMKQAIMEGGLKTATGRTARDDALARNATSLSTTDATNAAHLEATRLTNAAHIQAAGIHAAATSAASKNQLLQNAQAHAQAAGRSEVTQEDLDWSMKGMHAGARDPMDHLNDAMLMHAKLAGREGKPTQEDADWAMRGLHGGAGADARNAATDVANLRAADTAYLNDTTKLPFMKKGMETQLAEHKRRFYAQRGINLGVGAGATAAPDVRDPD
jgi:hypothetical protein